MSRVRVSLEAWPGMFHVWVRFASMLPESMEALRNAVTFLDTAPRATWGRAAQPVEAEQ